VAAPERWYPLPEPAQPRLAPDLTKAAAALKNGLNVIDPTKLQFTIDAISHREAHV
jgi:hypothetical protein